MIFESPIVTMPSFGGSTTAYSDTALVYNEANGTVVEQAAKFPRLGTGRKGRLRRVV